MANLSTAFLKVNSNNSCLLCEKEFEKSSKVVTFADKGWPTLKENAEKWSTLSLPATNSCYQFPTVHRKICNAVTSFGQAHPGCRIKFSTRFEYYQARFSGVDQDEKYAVDEDEKLSVEPDEKNPGCPQNQINTRLTSENISLYGVCFVCNISKSEDSRPYNDGGLATHTTPDGESKLKERTKLLLSDESYEYHQAACRFVRQAGGLDSTVEKIVYHQKCYIK